MLQVTDPIFFRSSADLRKWFTKNHDKEPDLWIGFYKKSAGKSGISYAEAVDQALCFGWIDDIRKGWDSESYVNRFTPRRPRSIWSAVNIKRIDELSKLGMMHESGLETFARRDVKRSKLYSHENRGTQLDPTYEERFKKNKKAWAFFDDQPPSYRRPAIWWVMSAKREETRQKRLTTLIDDSRSGRRIKHLARPS